MRLALLLGCAAVLVACSTAQRVSDDPRLAVLERVHPNGHVPPVDLSRVPAQEEPTKPVVAPRTIGVVARADRQVASEELVPGMTDEAQTSAAPAEPPSSLAPSSKAAPAAKAAKAAKHKAHKKPRARR